MGLAWRKSSFSEDVNCVQVAFPAEAAALRDSKDPGGRPLALPRSALTHLVRVLRAR
ncbi:hypothetical protein Acsp05_22520 [Actinokineospora sp. NBRC 105648]|nr:hypothetical protein Acsp05_22520 [Actinokineospora sp. NBRC 105648]